MRDYPNISHDDKKSVKLKLDDLERIKHLKYVENWSMRDIAELYKVSPSTIKYHVDESYKEKCIKRGVEYIKNRKLHDSDFKNRINNLNGTRNKERRLEPEFKRWSSELGLKNSRKPEYIIRAKKYYEENKEHIFLKQKERIQNNRESYLAYQRNYDKTRRSY